MTLDLLGRYEVVGRIAVGSDGGDELWLGREPTGRPVAIKRIPRGAGRGSVARHPNLVEIIEVMQVDEDYYLVMEYLEGENLSGLIRRLIKRRERIAYGLAAHMIAEVCDGLHAAHLAGELHRAINPETVFITYGGEVKVLDLGVAIVEPDSVYRSPEQADSRPLGRQSDVFSTGLVLYELTTLRRLFTRVGDMDLPMPLPSAQVQDYPQELEPIVLRAIALNPAERYRSAIELRDALLQLADALDVERDPQQALASKLMRLFGDRIASKRELLDKLRSGVALGDLVPTEADEEIEVPPAVRDARIPDDLRTDRQRRSTPMPAQPPPLPMQPSLGDRVRPSAPHQAQTRPSAPQSVQVGSTSQRGPIVMVSRASGQVSIPSPPPAERPSLSLPLPAPRVTPMPPPPVDDETRTTPAAPKASVGFRWGVALLVLVAVGGGGAAGAWLRLREDDVVTPTKRPRPPAPAADAGANALDAALPDFVTIGIDTEPGNAKVLVDGEERGVTPVDLRVAGGTKPIKIELRRDGYQPLVRELVPDRDRTLKEKLVH